MRIRPAVPGDAAGLCGILNDIIAAGGTTAHRRPFDAARLRRHYMAPPLGISCVVAEVGGVLTGFQSLEWCDPDWDGPGKLPADWAVVATFVDARRQGQGIGGRLFEATLAAAHAAGVVAIDATIRRENAGGLVYYSRMGFAEHRSDAERVSKKLDVPVE